MLVVLVIAALVVWRFHLWPRHEATEHRQPPSARVELAVPRDATPVIDAALPPPPPIAYLPIAHMPIPAGLPVANFVTGLVAVDGRLVWTDNFGSIWTMPATGGDARELANQHDGPGFPEYSALVVHRGTVYSSRIGAVATVALPAGPVTPLSKETGDDAYQLASDGTSLYGAMFDAHSVVRFADDGSETKLAAMHEGVFAAAGSAVYAADFGAGTVVQLAPVRRTVARNIPHPTGLAADDRAVYVWSQLDSGLRRVELATGKVTWRIAVTNGDGLIADGDWIYTDAVDQGASTLMRVAKDGSELDVLAPLDAYGRLAADADAIYTSGGSDGTFVRVDKARVQPIRIVKPATVAR